MKLCRAPVKHFAKRRRLKIGRYLPQIVGRQRYCHFVIRLWFLPRLDQDIERKVWAARPPKLVTRPRGVRCGIGADPDSDRLRLCKKSRRERNPHTSGDLDKPTGGTNSLADNGFGYGTSNLRVGRCRGCEEKTVDQFKRLPIANHVV